MKSQKVTDLRIISHGQRPIFYRQFKSSKSPVGPVWQYDRMEVSQNHSITVTQYCSIPLMHYYSMTVIKYESKKLRQNKIKTVREAIPRKNLLRF